MKSTIIVGILAVSILVIGCNKKTDAPSRSTTSSVASLPVLATWQQGNKAAAVASFPATDWSAHPLFAEGSVLSLTETQFRTLSAADRKAKADEMMPQLLSMRDLVQAVEQTGRDAATKGDHAQARKYFEALKQCGTALDDPDYTLLVRQIGQAIENLADKDLAR